MSLKSLQQAWEDSASRAVARIILQDQLSETDLHNSDTGLSLRSGLKGGHVYYTQALCVQDRWDNPTMGWC